MSQNLQRQVVAGFGDEWARFDQSGLDPADFDEVFGWYFRIFPWASLPQGAVGFDLGCGSGRWAKGVAPQVGTLHCIEPAAAALAVARKNLRHLQNCVFHHRGVDDIPLPDGTMDFGYALGVLHHVPDPEGGLRACVAKLKPGAPFLVYLYYRFDNRPAWYRALWWVSDRLRRRIAQMPTRIKNVVCDLLAATVYWPLARGAQFAEKCGLVVDVFPLSAYRNRTFYVMRTDALDRFGTRLEHRFTRAEVDAMMRRSGLTDIRFSDSPPYWVALGRRL